MSHQSKRWVKKRQNYEKTTTSF